MIGVMAGWVTSPWHGIPNTFVALAGLSGDSAGEGADLGRSAGRTPRVGRADLVRPAGDDGGRN